jgi:hypothetical protein
MLENDSRDAEADLHGVRFHEERLAAAVRRGDAALRAEPLWAL